MSDWYEAHHAIRDRERKSKAQFREEAANRLHAEGIPFSEHNGGAHLIVEGKACYIDFWPGTGKWSSRDGTKGFGLANLINHIKE